MIAVVMIAVLLAFTPKPMPNWMVESQTLPYAMEASNAIASLAPNTIIRRRTISRRSDSSVRTT